MTPTPDSSPAIEAVSVDQLAAVLGAGIGSQIGSLFGAKGAQWGGIADTVLGMFGLGGAGSLAGLIGGLGKSASPSPASSPATSSERRSPPSELQPAPAGED